MFSIPLDRYVMFQFNDAHIVVTRANHVLPTCLHTKPRVRSDVFTTFYALCDISILDIGSCQHWYFRFRRSGPFPVTVFSILPPPLPLSLPLAVLLTRLFGLWQDCNWHQPFFLAWLVLTKTGRCRLNTARPQLEGPKNSVTLQPEWQWLILKSGIGRITLFPNKIFYVSLFIQVWDVKNGD